MGIKYHVKMMQNEAGPVFRKYKAFIKDSLVSANEDLYLVSNYEDDNNTCVISLIVFLDEY